MPVIMVVVMVVIVMMIMVVIFIVRVMLMVVIMIVIMIVARGADWGPNARDHDRDRGLQKTLLSETTWRQSLRKREQRVPASPVRELAAAGAERE
jgi:hypothetical protein